MCSTSVRDMPAHERGAHEDGPRMRPLVCPVRPDAIAEGSYVPGCLSNSGGLGGVSSAEIAALLVLRADPTIQVVEASSCERYGADVVPPPGALVHFAGTAPEEGAMTIFSVVTAQQRDVCRATRGGLLARA